VSVLVHYIEGRSSDAGQSVGPDVQQRLSDVMAGLGHLPGFLGADLLCSPLQPGLYLLESRWAEQVPEFEIPVGCRAWAFTVTETWSPPPQA
jgi:hypothetical protein